jgi:hypothetical protein
VSAWEHTFVSSSGSAYARFQRAIDRDNVRVAESAAREMGFMSLGNALKLVVLYAEQDSPKFEPAAVKWLARLALEQDSIQLSDMLLAAAELVALRTAAWEHAARTLVSLVR